MAFTPSVNAAGTRRKNEVGQKWINLLKQLSFIQLGKSKEAFIWQK